MNRYAFALFACALSAAAQTNTLNVTATQLSQQTTRSMFGPLAKQYLAATVTVCNSGASSVSVPLAAVLQVPGAVPAGVTVLPPLAALTVIAAAQGSTKRAKIERGAIAAVSVAAVSTGFTGISQQAKTILTNVALNGPALVSPPVQSCRWRCLSRIGTGKSACRVRDPPRPLPDAMSLAH